MTIAAGLLPHSHRPTQIRQDGLEIGDDGLHALRFRLHPQQRLLEIEIERKRADQIE